MSDDELVMKWAYFLPKIGTKIASSIDGQEIIVDELHIRICARLFENESIAMEEMKKNKSEREILFNGLFDELFGKAD